MRKLLDVSFILVGIACAIYTVVYLARLPRRLWKGMSRRDVEQGRAAAELDRKRMMP